MEVLKLMNSNPNWRDVLGADPYNIIIKEDGEFVLLKYSQINSDFNLPIVRECRGAIFVEEEEGWRCVRRAFDKFGNYGESYAADIHWDTAVVQEKIDGSLMSVWYYKGLWHISTNGTIDAFKAPLGDTGMTFGDYFFECLGDEGIFFWKLNHCYCYTYEMVGPMNRVVIPYMEPKLYAIGQRNMLTMEEVPYNGPLGAEYNVWTPAYHELETLDQVIAAAKKMSKDEEGFVVRDWRMNRIKVKSPEYLMAARLHNNGVITKKRLVEIVQSEQVDDFIAYCPQYEAQILEVLDWFKKIEYEVISELDYVESNGLFALDRGQFAGGIKGFKHTHYLFGRYDGKFFSITEYLRSMRPELILKMVENLSH